MDFIRNNGNVVDARAVVLSNSLAIIRPASANLKLSNLNNQNSGH